MNCDAVLRRYAYGVGGLDDQAALLKPNGENWDAYYYLKDRLGSVVALADSSGAVVERYDYEPYGQWKITDETGGTDRTSSGSSYGNSFGFTGQYFDADIGLYYYKNRWYSPDLGRFATRDPAGYQDGMSLYLCAAGCSLQALRASAPSSSKNCCEPGARARWTGPRPWKAGAASDRSLLNPPASPLCNQCRLLFLAINGGLRMMAHGGAARVGYRLVILGSGSAGNSLLAAGRHGRILIDMGFSERRLVGDLAAQGLQPTDIQAIFITHTHGDHVGGPALRFSFRHGVPLVAPRENFVVLREKFGAMMGRLDRAGLVRELVPRGAQVGGIHVRPFEVPHDAEGLNLGYHLTLGDGPGSAPLTVAVATDLGHVPPEVLRVLARANVLVLESNHDPGLLAASGRPAYLIERIESQRGHLANRQAAEALGAILDRQAPGELRRVVLAHLSRECNEPRLALAAARRAVKPLGRAAPQVRAAGQDKPLPIEWH